MNWRFEKYRLFGQRRVAGWLQPGALTLVKVLDRAQRSTGISGAIAEIGVHHGKLFIALLLLQGDDECAVAIDLFGDQELNIDKSGEGDLERFRGNLERWSGLGRVVVHQGDSTKLTSAEVCALATAKIRLFSVDGGHTDEIVFSDMNLAEGTLCDGGIVIADDVFNEWWPGVASGTLRYMAGKGSLQPFAVGFNKVFFASADYAPRYRDILANYLSYRHPLVAKTAHLGECEVLVIGRDTVKVRRYIRRSKTVRNLIRRIRSVQ